MAELRQIKPLLGKFAIQKKKINMRKNNQVKPKIKERCGIFKKCILLFYFIAFNQNWR